MTGSRGWATTTLDAEDQVFKTLADLQGRSWITRGHSRARRTLLPSIDRGWLRRVPRPQKLVLEREGIDILRSNARFFSSPGELGALTDDFIGLAVLRHHGVPTRLVDWSRSPYIAAYFSVSDHAKSNGDLWTFSYVDYRIEGAKQWEKHKDTTADRSGHPDEFQAGLTAFRVDPPPPWIIMMFYPDGFPRQNAQLGAYTLTSEFNVDHGHAIRTLLIESDRYHRFVIPARLKPTIQARLRQEHGIWKGSLFPDTAGAAHTAHAIFERRRRT